MIQNSFVLLNKRTSTKISPTKNTGYSIWYLMDINKIINKNRGTEKTIELISKRLLAKKLPILEPNNQELLTRFVPPISLYLVTKTGYVLSILTLLLSTPSIPSTSIVYCFFWESFITGIVSTQKNRSTKITVRLIFWRLNTTHLVRLERLKEFLTLK